MNDPENNALVQDLRQHLEVCRNLLAVVERESLALRQSAPGLPQEFAQKKNLLPILNQSLNKIRQHRVEWCRRSPQERAKDSGVAALIREIQDLIMKIIVIDRENEQALLRNGLVPARHLPPANRQRPQFVAGLYRQQKDSGFGGRPGPNVPN